MAIAKLRHGGLLVSLDLSTGALHFSRAGTRLPWELDLGATSSVTVRKRVPGASDEQHPIRLAALESRRLSATRLQWIGEIGGAGVALDVELAADGLVFTASPTGTGDADVISAAWPGELRVRAASREACWSDYNQGALFRSDGKPWSETLEWWYLAMRFFGFTAAGESLAVILETHFDARTTLADDGAGVMSSNTQFLPSLGRLAYPRRTRFVSTPESGYVAIANAFRDYAQTHGLWKSFDERVAENPEADKLRGAFVACAGYWWDPEADQVGAMKAMRKMGFKRGWVFSPKLFSFGSDWNALGVDSNRLTDAQLAEIQSLGYLCAPFLQVEEAGPSIGLEKFAVDEKGERIVRWEIGERKYWEIAKWRVPSMLPQFESELLEGRGIHFDTVAAMPEVENWGERPYDREGDARLRAEIADYYRRRGKVICAESLRDWCVPHCDLSTSKIFAPVRTRDNRVWTLPLSDLVYHDSTPRSTWEHHSYDDKRNVRDLIQLAYHPFGMELTDLLTASPPVLFPEGMLYYYELKDVTLSDGTKDLAVDWTKAHLYRKRFTDPETQAALPKALRVCRLNERHGVSRMTSHRFVDPKSPFVQETEFASGLHVIVNFSDASFTLPDGRTVPARGSIVEE